MLKGRVPVGQGPYSTPLVMSELVGVPLIVVSPYAKKNFVSHSVADLTAILKLIETRFNVAALTKRDAAQIDMTEFFDFNNPPWVTPPTPPAQNVNGACYLNKLP